MTETLALVQRVRHGRLTDDDKKLLTSFRLGELQKAKTAKLQEIERIDREAKVLAGQ